MSARNNGTTGGPSGPSVVYRRIRKLTREEFADVPPIRTKPVEFKGKGLGPYGCWKPGNPVGPVKRDPEALLDWALVSWARRHVVEEVWDFDGTP
jgi:hypothetical protein